MLTPAKLTGRAGGRKRQPQKARTPPTGELFSGEARLAAYGSRPGAGGGPFLKSAREV